MNHADTACNSPEVMLTEARHGIFGHLSPLKHSEYANKEKTWLSTGGRLEAAMSSYGLKRLGLCSTETGPYMYIGAAGVLLLWLATGFYVVGPGEQGVERRFGRHMATTDPGLNYRLPWPIQTVDVVNVDSIRRVEVGFRTTAAGRMQGVLEEALMLTKDENIVEVQVLIQYRVKDPAAFLFRVQNPEGVLASAAEVALRGTVGRMRIDERDHRNAAPKCRRRLILPRTLLDEYNTASCHRRTPAGSRRSAARSAMAFHEVGSSAGRPRTPGQ